MYLTDFMNENSDWQAKLAVAPYCLETKEDSGYFILKYNMLRSDFTEPMVKEARGSIFRRDENGIWICVCRALDKFGNYGEFYADTPLIDWNLSVDVQEKVDGSIIKVWYDCGEWHISTNGTIDAFKAECGDTTFGDLFVKVLGSGLDNFDTIFSRKDCCYFFELVCPLYNHIVVRYKEDAIYYLGCRNLISGEEMRPLDIELDTSNIKYPRHFTYYSLSECVDAAHQMGVDEEGYVVTAYNQMENGSFLRIKVKGDEYLRLHKLRGNGALTSKTIVEMWQKDSLDDFMAYYPEFKAFINEILAALRKLIQTADLAYDSLKGFENRKDFALRAATYISPLKSFLFARKDNKVKNAEQFFYEMRPRQLGAHINAMIGDKKIGVSEDEQC